MKSFSYISSAYTSRDIEATFLYSLFLIYGIGTEPNQIKGIKLFKESVTSGSVYANSYLNDTGLSIDEVITEFRKDMKNE